MATLPTARSLFRRLRRACATTFKDDALALKASREQIRKSFEEFANLDGDGARLKIEEGVEAESFIRLHVVQSKGWEGGDYRGLAREERGCACIVIRARPWVRVNDRGNYEMRVEPHHVDGEYEVPGAGPGGCSGTRGK